MFRSSSCGRQNSVEVLFSFERLKSSFFVTYSFNVSHYPLVNKFLSSLNLVLDKFTDIVKRNCMFITDSSY